MEEEEGPPQEEALRVYFDCKAITCLVDEDFFRTEIDFVNWVRDQEDSDVHLLITGQTTGGGGWSHDLFFIGMGRFESRDDTLRYFSSADDVQDTRREGLAQMIRIGLVRYVGETPGADLLEIRHRPVQGETGLRTPGMGRAATTAEDDPWDFWVFRTSLSGSVSGESSIKSLSYNGSFSANRVTEEWKISFTGRGSYSETDIDYGGTPSHSFSRTWSGTSLIVRSLTDHWSTGFRTSANYSTYSNYDLSLKAAPVLEYNVFPYTESTRRMLTLQYAVEGVYNDYKEETLHGKLKESRISESFGASLNLTQPWGSWYASLVGQHYFDDIDQHHVSFYTGLDFRVTRGLRFNISGSYGRILDRINVQAGEDLTEEEILLRLRQFQTEYEYRVRIGFSYTFGSIYNNIVNPRIGGGGMMIFF